MFIDRELLAKIEEPEVWSPYDGDRSSVSVSDWLGYKYFVLHEKPVREEAPLSFTPAMDERLEDLLGFVDKEKSKADSMNSLQNRKREEQIYKWELEINDLVLARKELSAWEFNQIARCLKGYKYFTPYHYQYYNFGTITENIPGTDTSQRTIRPLYRAADNMSFNVIFKEKSRVGGGLVGGKRRQFGWTWILVAYIINRALLSQANIFFISRDDKDISKFFNRIDTYNNGTPAFLRGTFDRDSATAKKITMNEKVFAVRQALGMTEATEMLSSSMIRAASPKNAPNLVGDNNTDVIVDEPGEIMNMDEIWDKIEPAMKASNSLHRSGFFIALGTVGSMLKAGAQFKSFFDAAEAFQISQFYVHGCMGIDPDEYGNESPSISHIESVIRRKVALLISAGKGVLAVAERQKYPLDWSDLWLEDITSSIIDVEVLIPIQDRLTMADLGSGIVYGVFVRSVNGLEFVRQQANPPKKKDSPRHIGYGQWAILESELIPRQVGTNGYVIAVDPVDLDTDTAIKSGGMKKWNRSDIAATLWRRASETGTGRPYPVGVYVGRPPKVDTAFEQIALCSTSFNRAPVNMERAKGSRMYGWMITNGYESQIAYGTEWITQDGNNIREWGWNTTPSWWIRMIGMAEEYFRENGDLVFFDQIIAEAYWVKRRNTDLFVAFLGGLAYCSELDSRDTISIRGGELGLPEITFYVDEQGRTHPGKQADYASMAVSTIKQGYMVGFPSTDLLKEVEVDQEASDWSEYIHAIEKQNSGR